MKEPYKLTNNMQKPSSTLISIVLGAGSVIAVAAGLIFFIRGEEKPGLAALVVAVAAFAASYAINYCTKKAAKAYYAENPESLFELFYENEKKKLEHAFSKGKLTREEVIAKLAELDLAKEGIESLSAPREEIQTAEDKPESYSNIIPVPYDDGDEETVKEKSIIPDGAFLDGDEETFFLDDGDEDTMILEGDAEEEATMALLAFEKPKPKLHLIRTSDNEKLDFNGTMFTVGSSTMKADYAVTSNKHVSRNHATIFLNGDDFYIKDNSRNGTFVNDEKVEEEQSVAIKDGDTIALADESFVVLIEKPGEIR